jgi:hypothetical protein
MTDVTPAIRTELDRRYEQMELIKRIGSNTQHLRGLGDIGTVVELVDMSFRGGCPRCGTDEMVLSKYQGPESADGAFYCTNISCPHFVQDAVETDMTRIRADQPEVWDNTAECPECDTRHTIEVRRHRPLHGHMIEHNIDIVERLCDDCADTQRVDA